MTIQTIEDYRQVRANGSHIRKATKVVFSDGSEIRFMDRMTKREVRQHPVVIKKLGMVPTRKVIDVGGRFGDLLTLECRHVISIEIGSPVPSEHACWQCRAAGE